MLAAFVILIIIGSVAGDDQDAADTTVSAADTTATTGTSSTTLQPTTTTQPTTSTADGSTTTTEATTTTTEATTTTAQPTTTTTEPTTTTTTTTTVPTFEAFTVEGTGDDVIDFSIPGDEPAVAEIAHTGSSNFAVLSYTAQGERIDLLVNTIGSYEGNRPVNFLQGEEVGELEITADGPWTITGRPLTDSPELEESYEGTGDEVLLYTGTASRLAITHSGESNFVVLAWSSDDRDLLVNEIGPYEGTVRIDPSALVIEITADGAWTLQTE